MGEGERMEEIGEGDQEVQPSSYKINCYGDEKVQHRE